MNDQELMEDDLRTALSSRPPELSSAFDRTLMRRVAPRRLTTAGRLILGGYSLLSLVLCVWLMRDWPVALTAGAVIVASTIAIALWAYTASLTRRLTAPS